MAHSSGGTKENAIYIEDYPRYLPAPAIENIRRQPQAFSVTNEVIDLTHSDDDKDTHPETHNANLNIPTTQRNSRNKDTAGFNKPRNVRRPARNDQDVIEAERTEWSAAHSRKSSRRLNSDVGQASPSTPRRGGASRREIISPVVPAKLDLPNQQGTVNDEEGVAPVWEEEHQGNPGGNEPGTRQVASSPSDRFPARLPERNKVSPASKVNSSPSIPGPAAATPSPPAAPVDPHQSLVDAIRSQREIRARLPNPPLVANSSHSEPLASTVTSEGELLIIPPCNQPPASTSSANAVPPSASTQDGLKTMPANLQEGHNMPQRGGGSESPIGELTDHGREQTTSSRVNNAATIERSVDKSDTTVPMPANTHDPPRRKQRAVKSAPSVIQGRVFISRARPSSNQQSQPPTKDGSLPQVVRQTPTAKDNSNGFVQPEDQNLGKITKSKSTDQREILSMPAQRSSEPAQASSSAGERRTQRFFSTRTIFNQSSGAVPAQNAISRTTTIASSPRHETLLPNDGLSEENQGHDTRGHFQGRPKSKLTIDLSDINASRLAVEACLREQLADRHESHANLTASQMWRQRTCHERELRAEYHGRTGPRPPSLPEKYVQTVSPFANMSSIQVSFENTTSDASYKDITQEIFGPNKSKDSRSAWGVRPTMYWSDAIRIPAFKEYVYVNDSILADNESKLLATPYLQDEDDHRHADLIIQLPTHYEMKHDTNASADVRNQQCLFYEGTIKTFLEMIGVSWDSILFWLLAPEHEIKRINDASPYGDSFKEFLLDRSNYHLEHFMREEEEQTAVLFDREAEKWNGFWAPPEKKITTEQCRLSAIVCAAVLKQCGFSIWYLAQRSKTLQTHISSKLLAPGANSTLTFRDMVCRVCHQHNCLLHGELRQVPEDCWNSRIVQRDSGAEEWVDDSDIDQTEGPAHFDDDDSDIEKVISYKVPANPDAFNMYPDSEMIESRGVNPPREKFDRKWWSQHSHMEWKQRKPFFPCSHEGSCKQADCRCFRENIPCEKTCRCSRNCQRRFPGCKCASKPKTGLCRTKSTCICLAFGRECDADLCGMCGAAEILNPVNRFNEDMLKDRCTNVAIQRAVSKKTFLGHSEVHGFGLYIGEDVKSGDYIGEYTGETISRRESARRQVIYGYQKTMYLFSLNEKQEVDATYMGNKLRFINNADKHLSNCKPKNLLCNTVFRLALYASANLKAGTELFFNYNYPKEKTVGFKQPKSTAKRKMKKVAKSKGKTKSLKLLKHKKSSASSSRTRTSGRKLRIRANLTDVSAQEPTSSNSKPLQRARKSATDQSSRQRQPPRRLYIPTGSHVSDASTDEESEEDHDSQSTQEIQETDSEEEDDEFALDEQQDSANESGSSEADEEDTAVEGSDNGSMRSTRSQAQSSVPLAQVVAMKKVVNQRPVRKRKRIIANSDDE